MLDSGPLGLMTNPRLSPESLDCARWFQSLVTAGVRVMIPEIVDYEVRRELLRANKLKGLRRLDEFADLAEYLPITTIAMKQAAQFWAEARQQGQPTAGDKTIDADVDFGSTGDYVVRWRGDDRDDECGAFVAVCFG